MVAHPFWEHHARSHFRVLSLLLHSRHAQMDRPDRIIARFVLGERPSVVEGRKPRMRPLACGVLCGVCRAPLAERAKRGHVQYHVQYRPSIGSVGTGWNRLLHRPVHECRCMGELRHPARRRSSVQDVRRPLGALPALAHALAHHGLRRTSVSRIPVRLLTTPVPDVPSCPQRKRERQTAQDPTPRKWTTLRELGLH